MSIVRIRLERGPAVRGMTQGEYLRLLRGAVLDMSGAGGPKPRVTTGPQLPLGYTSRCEYADLDLGVPMTAGHVVRVLPSHLPGGLDLRWARRISRIAPALRACIRGYWYTLDCALEAGAAEVFFLADSWPFTRVRNSGKKQKMDLRESVRRIIAEPRRTRMCIAAGEGEAGTPKPEEVLQSVWGCECAGPETVAIERTEALMAPGATGRPPAWSTYA